MAKKVFQMKKVIVILFLVVAMMIPSILIPVDSNPTRAPRSGLYPVNYEMQDHEPSAEEQWDLDVAQDEEGRLYAVWGDERDKSQEIRFSKSLNGTSWGDGENNNNDIIVSDGPGGDEQLSHPSITVGPHGTLFCIWMDDRDGEPRLRMSTSNTSGNYWTPSSVVPGIAAGVTEPEIGWSSSIRLSIVYVEKRIREGGSKPQNDIMFTSSKDEGITFSTPVVLNNDATERDQIHPRMSISSTGRIGIVWQDCRNCASGSSSNIDIFMTFSDDGVRFEPNIAVGNDSRESRQENPDLAFSHNGDLMIVWQEMGLDGWKIRYSFGWLGSDTWNKTIINDHPAVAENLSRLDQFKPRVDYVNGAFCIAWTELDLRDFYSIRAGYISRDGETASGDHIVDDSIDWGMFINDPIYHAEMYRETVDVLGYMDRAQVFWLDYRSDTNPSNSINEDADPYTARAFPSKDVPLPPETPRLRAYIKDWNSIGVSWDVSPDIEFKGYFLKYGRGNVSEPDEYLNDGAVFDRLRNTFDFRNLDPDTSYNFRLLVKDRLGNTALSNILSVRTDPNQPPVIYFLEPDGNDDTANTEYTIRWFSSDREDVAHYTFYYDDDLNPDDQVFLFSGDTQSGGEGGEFIWNTSGLEPGGYTINATIDDGVNDPVTLYSKAILVSHPGKQNEHLRVLSVIIDGGRDNAFADTTLKVTFDRPVATSTLGPESAYLLDSNQRKVEGILSILGSTEIEWRPQGWLYFSTTYTFTITPSVKDVSGNAIDGEGVGEASTFILTFTTRSDAGVPHVRDYDPKGSQAPLWPEIQIKFDIPMAQNTLNNRTIRVMDTDGNLIPIVLYHSPADLVLNIKTLRPLAPNTTYRVNLSRSIISKRGEPLGYFEWSFSSGRPRMDRDRDSDGVPDDLDWFPDDPNENMDTDGDGKGDNRDNDDDNDGMPDEWEINNGLDPRDPSDANGDPDGDRVTNLEEFHRGTDPRGSSKGRLSSETLILILAAISVVILMILLLYGIAKHRRTQRMKMERRFFMDGEREE